MAYLLRILVAVTMISLCSAQCMTEPIGNLGFNAHKHSVYAKIPKGCWQNGEFHPLNDEWKTKDCMKCTCYKDHISCCTDYAKPKLADTKNCVGILHKDTCTVEVKRKDNLRKTCEVESWVA